MASFLSSTPAAKAWAVLLASAAATLPVQAQQAPPATTEAAAGATAGAATAPQATEPVAAATPSNSATSAAQDFPADAQVLSASELDARLRGKVYTATLANGLRWRGDYKASGYVFFNMGNDGKWSGAWRTEDGKVCVDYRGPARTSCTEMRSGAQQVLYARSSTTARVAVMVPESNGVGCARPGGHAPAGF